MNLFSSLPAGIFISHLDDTGLCRKRERKMEREMVREIEGGKGKGKVEMRGLY